MTPCYDVIESCGFVSRREENLWLCVMPNTKYMVSPKFHMSKEIGGRNESKDQVSLHGYEHEPEALQGRYGPNWTSDLEPDAWTISTVVGR